MSIHGLTCSVRAYIFAQVFIFFFLLLNNHHATYIIDYAVNTLQYAVPYMDIRLRSSCIFVCTIFCSQPHIHTFVSFPFQACYYLYLTSRRNVTIYIVLFRAKIGANTPLRHKCSSRYKLGVTPTSSALPRTLPSYLSQILNSTSYGLSLGVMLKCGALSLGVMFFWGRALSMLLYKLGVGLVGDKIGNHPNRPQEH